jgi:L-ascorbate metabolism protein UlaG (beta-lactamase superfamily)
VQTAQGGLRSHRRAAGAALAVGCWRTHVHAMSMPSMPSDHFDGERFFNPSLGPSLGPQAARRGLWQVLRWRFTGERPDWPKTVANRAYPPSARPQDGQASVTFIGHASFLIQLPGCTILTDPVFSDRASPVRFAGPRRVRAPGVALSALPPIDLILLSHNHYDHADLASLRVLAANHAPACVTLLGNAPLLRRAGLQAAELDWWGETMAAGLHVTALPARHFSRRTLRDANRALWGGFMLKAGAHRIMFAGDSGAGPHWAEINQRLGPPDLALLPIGAYEPRWIMAAVHMNPEEAVQAHHDLGAKTSIGMHFGTFRLTDEAIDAPVKTLAEICARRNVRNFTVLDVGESRLIDL